jgi:hypothetical protein
MAYQTSHAPDIMPSTLPKPTVAPCLRMYPRRVDDRARVAPTRSEIFLEAGLSSSDVSLAYTVVSARGSGQS